MFAQKHLVKWALRNTFLILMVLIISYFRVLGYFSKASAAILGLSWFVAAEGLSQRKSADRSPVGCR